MGNLTIAHLFHFPFFKLENHNILSLGTFLALSYFELNTLAFFEIAKTVTADGAIVNKDIFATFALNKAVAFAAVEPFHGSCYFFRHCLELLSSVIAE